MSQIDQNNVVVQENKNSQLLGIDYVELYVGNARQAAHYYRTAFGFTPVAYAGLETGLRDRATYVMRQGDCYLLLTSPLGSQGPIAEHVWRHGDGVKDIALRVKDARQAFDLAIRGGASALLEPTVFEDAQGRVIQATVQVYGDVAHSFIQREGSLPTFLPSYQELSSPQAPSTGLCAVDHFALSLPPGTLQQWVRFYIDVFGFVQIHEEGIATAYSAMSSTAIQDSTGSIKLVLIEPIVGQRKSQIEEFLKFYEGPGVQHLALLTNDIVKTIHTLQTNGVNFVSAPASYYEMLTDRVGAISEDTAALREVNVLVDRDDWGYLLQIFSLPLQSRPTYFIEIIERKNARGFGSGNIQALFKALEQEQAKRGNL